MIAKKRVLPILVAVLMVFAMMPMTAGAVYAASGDPAMNLNTDVLDQNVSKKDAQTVWYGSSAWRVIGYDESGTMRLLASVSMGKSIFNQQSSSSNDSQNDYKGSRLQSKIAQLYEELFSEDEKASVIERTLGVDEYKDTPPYSNGVSGSSTTGYLWPLSTAEAYELTDNGSAELLQISDHWWLRSPGSINPTAAFVRNDGAIHISGAMVSANFDVRPAFDLDIGNVLFTSAVEGGKSSGDEGKDALKSVGTNPGIEWKLTLLDEGRDFDVISCDPSQGVMKITYEDAETGDNEYISAIIMNDDSDITYYGRIKNCRTSDDASGEVTIKMPETFSGSDKLYIFNEQYNGEKKTDLASALNEVTVPELISYDVTFKVVNGAWNDGTTSDKTVTLSKYESEDLALVLKPDDIPAAGSKPGNGYKAGSWDPTPDEEIVITENKTYTYTYEKEAAPTPDPEDKVSGTLLSKMTAKGKNSLVLTWNKINGAEGYDIFFGHCGKDAPETVITIEGNKTFKWTKKGLKPNNAFRAVVKAYVTENGKKTYVSTGPKVHAYTSGGTKKYTNAKSVTVKKTKVMLKEGKKYKIKAGVTKLRKGKKLMPAHHEPKLRYVSSNKNIATVSKSGKITARGKGSCKVYVIAVNGARKAVAVTVN